MKRQYVEEPSFLAAADRQMLALAHAQAIRDRTPHTLEIQSHSRRVRRYVYISREVGAGGRDIARLVGERLGWEVLDSNILDRLAERYHLSLSKLKLVDETRASWAHDVVWTWFDRSVIPHEKYVAHLSRVVPAIARRRNVVFVGRGIQFLLPADKGLTVRIIAPDARRIREIRRRRDLSAVRARRFREKVDRGRREFVRRYFHQDIDDPHLYDMVLRIDRTDPDTAADLIVEALHRQLPPGRSRRRG